MPSVASVRRLDIFGGDAGTAQTVAAMGDLIRDGALTPAVRAVAVDVASAQPQDNPLAQLLGLREWLALHFQFVRDPASGELLHDPNNLLRQVARYGVARGDCDDAAILGGALACAVGFHVALITVALDEGAPHQGDVPFSHVWASASPPEAVRDRAGRQVWIELDVTRPMQRIPVDRIARAQATQVC